MSMQNAPIAAGTSTIVFAAPAVGATCAVFVETGCLVAVPLPPVVIELVVLRATEVAVPVCLWPERDDEPNDEADDGDR